MLYDFNMLTSPSGLNQQSVLLVKDNLAAYFREEIISGRLAPGEKLVELRWSKQLKISQTSVREAFNILMGEGFIQKGSGRTAEVTKLTNDDVAHSYELRAVLEGYAARIVAQKKLDLSELEQAVADMRSAIECNNIRGFYERDLHFHVLLAEKTGNRMLVAAIKRIVIPLFAFVVMRVHGGRTEISQWTRSIDQHMRIIEALKTHDPVFAERLVSRTVTAFQEETRDVVQSSA
jgi:DNA-binding GntR family transcriptional regulator